MTRRMAKQMLTPEMQKAIDWIKLHGSIERYEGGFWSIPNSPMITLLGDALCPVDHVGTNTINALFRRGLIISSETKTSKYGSFTVQYKLTPSPTNKQQ